MPKPAWHGPCLKRAKRKNQSMFTKLHSFWRKTKRFFSRAAWAPVLLGLDRSGQDAEEPGLVLLQIDGLAFQRMKAALEDGRLPFVKRLLEREDYKVREFYPGLPSTTPAVQGELFYGVKAAVPAFEYRRAADDKMVKMTDFSAASHVEDELRKKGMGLMADGSAYSNIYTGGADEAHFCSSFVGWTQDRSIKSSLRLLVFLLLNLHIVLRVAVLGMVEMGLAVLDVLRSRKAFRELPLEIKFIPVRMLITVVMRELIVFGVRMDLIRGLPVVEANFLGYDEQSHRRGPDSAFALWTLKGIDFALRRIFREAELAKRDYHVWIYSDHGQEEVTSFSELTGKTIRQVVHDTLNQPDSSPTRTHAGVEHLRANWLGFFSRLVHPDQQKSHGVQVSASGPISHVYLPDDVAPDQCRTLAQQLVHDGKVPMVMWKEGEGAVVMDAERNYALPVEGQELFPDREDCEMIMEDIVRLAHHTDAGDLVLLGWRRNEKPVTFAVEAGAHGGPGSVEMTGFLLAPDEMGLFEKGILRPKDLWRAALQFQGRVEELAQVEDPRVKSDKSLRVVTYNIHSCLGMDGRYSARRIARALARLQADVICLQEVDVKRARSGLVDQAEVIAKQLGMKHYFHPVVLQDESEEFGNAIISRLPLRLVRWEMLPAHKGYRACPRGAILVEVQNGKIPVHILNTHLSLLSRERQMQVKELSGEEWLGSIQGPLVMCGDLNMGITSRECKVLLESSALETAAAGVRTWPSAMPLRQIDHVLVSSEMVINDLRVAHTSLTRVASDHLPLVAQIELQE